MKRNVLLTALLPPLSLAPLTLAPMAAAQEAAPSEESSSLIEDGAQLLLKGLLKEMEPALDDMARALDEARPMLEEIGPQLSQLLEIMGDIRYYDKPIVLPNGDIIMRRNADAPPFNPKPLITPKEQKAPENGPRILEPILPGRNGEIEL